MCAEEVSEIYSIIKTRNGITLWGGGVGTTHSLDRMLTKSAAWQTPSPDPYFLLSRDVNIILFPELALYVILLDVDHSFGYICL